MTNFDSLVSTIQDTNFTLQQSASKAINRYLTIRNWLIGFHIVEFEQNGEDRARYGQRLVDDLADALNIAGLGGRNLKLFRQFYLTYPQIMQTLSAQLGSIGMAQLNVSLRSIPVCHSHTSPCCFPSVSLKSGHSTNDNAPKAIGA